MRRTTIALIAVTACAVYLDGQTPARLAFDVASVKPNSSGTGSPTTIGMQPGGRITMTNVPLRVVIQLAYQVQPFQIVGAPDWIATATFDIVAKAPADVAIPPGPPVPGGPPTPQLQMMRSLLEDRFALKVRPETRDMPVYHLVPARADGKLGPALVPSQADCAALMRQRQAAPPAPPKPSEPPPCGMMMGFGRLAAGSIPIAQLAAMLSQRLNRIVVDRTGLTGNYDISLDFLPDTLPTRAPGAPADQPIQFNGATIDMNAPPLMTAVQEQLGLKLESTRGPVDVLVVDAVSQPSPD